MIFKALYDFDRPNWHAYGHVLFVEAEAIQARDTALAAIHQVIAADAVVTRLDLSEATTQQRHRHNSLVDRQVLWLRNVANGIPNTRGIL